MKTWYTYTHTHPTNINLLLNLISLVWVCCIINTHIHTCFTLVGSKQEKKIYYMRDGHSVILHYNQCSSVQILSVREISLVNISKTNNCPHPPPPKSGFKHFKKTINTTSLFQNRKSPLIFSILVQMLLGGREWLLWLSDCCFFA